MSVLAIFYGGFLEKRRTAAGRTGTVDDETEFGPTAAAQQSRSERSFDGAIDPEKILRA
jgi:hypothetical protein